MKEILANNIVVIVLNYKTKEQTKRNVDFVLANNKNIIVTIVDNNSQDGSFEFLTEQFSTFENVHIIKSPANGGYSVGNNFGIRYILKKVENVSYIAIMNPDVKCTEENLFLKMAQALQEDETLAVVSPLMIQDENLVVYKMGWKCDTLKYIFQKKSILMSKFIKNLNSYACYLMNDTHDVAYCEVVQGSLFMIKRNLFEQVGLFDENVFLYYEEAILGYKLKQLGYFEGTLLTSQYIHEHTLKKQSLEKRKSTIQQDFKSARYYCENYLKVKPLMLYVIDFFSWYYLNVGLLICDVVHFMKTKIKNNLNSVTKKMGEK